MELGVTSRIDVSTGSFTMAMIRQLGSAGSTTQTRTLHRRIRISEQTPKPASVSLSDSQR